ncbi:endo alpha-1,4 polygalactosaminidase [Paraburkholderia sp. LEh10]|uniref:endo alpha-1,4 polygalactosaminidase n=1 Tax=Paraburkholderia sp. LEh10 TaxID=2821353 RepID=UPI001AE6CCCC|nr:endo alpha-1,4 polygalactosaminidase [Paraburkholderia sp. LEh10]MBP0594383.1 endo alpha-1,4 polygalactosaminidase [Paraburkholderia sp. LEh10]
MKATSLAHLGVSWIVAACAAVAILLLSVAWLRPALSACKRVSASGIGAVAFYYGANVRAEQFESFDTVVLEPDSGFDPAAHLAHCPKWYAYVSVGEVSKARAYYAKMPHTWLLAADDARDAMHDSARDSMHDSAVVDQTAPGWPAFFVDEIIEPLWERGYRGFFLDTLDSYRRVAQTDAARAKQQAGLVAVLHALKARYPQAQLILNRGFEILPQVHDQVAAVAFESLFGRWDRTNQRYGAVPDRDREWLLGEAREVHERYQLPVISIDYCAPGDDACREDIVRKIGALGIVPYVTDGGLQTIGVSRAVIKDAEPLISVTLKG